MRRIPRVLAAGCVMVAFDLLCGLGVKSAEQPAPDFIVTAAPVYKQLAELRGEERFPRGAQLMLVHDGKPEAFVPGFAASADADVSFDGKSILFAGKRAQGDPWQIWELTLEERSVRRVTSTASDAVRPFYLPGGRLVWAQRTATGFEIDSSDDGFKQESAPLNPTAGPGVLALTYLQTSAFPTGVMHDGRILFESGFPLGSGSMPEIYLVYADGSGVESYRCDHGRARWGARQLASGDVIFTHGTSLGRFSSSLAHEAAIVAPSAQYAGEIAEADSGAWLVSARETGHAHYAIQVGHPASSPGQSTARLETLLAMDGTDLVDPAVVAAHPRPNRHPSGLHPWNYANLLALDARVSRDGVLRQSPAAVRLESEDSSGRAIVAGTAPVEQDGSFFVRVPPDRPIRFALLDRSGAVLRKEQGWFWIRGGEQRICVGCHAGPERASDNRVPAVLLRTTTPADLTGGTSGHSAPGGR